jgi:molybdopterin/thiamine biosynthesis adenylyltransferase
MIEAAMDTQTLVLVLVVGAGGLGSPALLLLYLVACGSVGWATKWVRQVRVW